MLFQKARTSFRPVIFSAIRTAHPNKEYRASLGTAPRIQLNDKFAEVDAIRDYVAQERESMPERDKPYMKISLKVDKKVQMGIVTDVKLALRKASALNLVYSASKKKDGQ